MRPLKAHFARNKKPRCCKRCGCDMKIVGRYIYDKEFCSARCHSDQHISERTGLCVCCGVDDVINEHGYCRTSCVECVVVTEEEFEAYRQKILESL